MGNFSLPFLSSFLPSSDSFVVLASPLREDPRRHVVPYHPTLLLVPIQQPAPVRLLLGQLLVWVVHLFRAKFEVERWGAVVVVMVVRGRDFERAAVQKFVAVARDICLPSLLEDRRDTLPLPLRKCRAVGLEGSSKTRDRRELNSLLSLVEGDSSFGLRFEW